jgi:dTDP-4-dehydrorhamnose 3,5-epimerase
MGENLQMNSTEDLLTRTLAAAEKDAETVKDGLLIVPLLEGMSIYEATPIIDERGSLTELFDPRWNFPGGPLTYTYITTLRPGVVKGWALHKEHEDRYFCIEGEMELVVYDPRPGSGTYGQIAKVQLSDRLPRLVNVPRFVWHADYNYGTRDVKIVSFPTRLYDHKNPDKYRLPIDTPLIPYSFGNAKGW